jgi:hypothetical protein
MGTIRTFIPCPTASDAQHIKIKYQQDMGAVSWDSLLVIGDAQFSLGKKEDD